MADNISISRAELQALLAGVTEAATKNTLAAVAEMMAKQPTSAPQQIGSIPGQDLPSGLPADQQKENAYAKATGQPVQDRTPKVEERIQCLTSKGARFDAIVVKARTYPDGVCVRLENYREPEFTDKAAPHTLDADGNYGYPKGIPVTLGKNSTALNPLFKQWKWVTFWKADLERYVGHDARELPRAPAPYAKAAPATKAA